MRLLECFVLKVGSAQLNRAGRGAARLYIFHLFKSRIPTERNPAPCNLRGISIIKATSKPRVGCRLWSDSTGARGRSPLDIQLFVQFRKLHLRFISVDPVNRVFFQYPIQHDCNLDLNLKNDFFSIFPPCYYDPVNSLQEIKSENILKSLFYSIFIKNLQDRQI